MFKKPLIAVALAVASTSLLADEKQSSDADITVTKSFKTSLAESIGITQIITREEIATSAATSLIDVLTSVSGISTYRKGGDASLSQIRIRGFEDEQVLIYVDGVLVNDLYFGTHRLEFIDVQTVEAIEIAQGPASMAYGSGSAAGVISITTRGNKSTGTSGTYLAGIGSDEYAVTSGSLEHSMTNGASLSVKASESQADGYDVREDTDPDVDGWNKSSFSGSITKEIDQSELTITRSEQTGNLMIDGDPANQNNIRHSIKNTSLGFSSNQTFGTFEFIHGLSDVNEVAYENTDVSNQNIYDTQTKNTSIFFSPTTSDKTYEVRFGADHTRGERAATFSGSGPYFNFAENTGFILSGSHSALISGVDRAAVTVRHDDNKDWGNHSSVATTFALNDERLGSTLITAASNFRAPTFAEYEATKGERTNQVQVDYSKNMGKVTTFDLSLTKARTPNKLLQGNGTGGLPQGENRINFVSTTLSTMLNTTELMLIYEYTDSRLKEKNWTRMPFVPDHKVTAQMQHQSELGTSTLTLNANSGYFTDYLEPNASRQPGYTDINIAHLMRIGSNVITKLAIENVLDRSIVYAFDSTTQQRFALPGRQIMITLQGTF